MPYFAPAGAYRSSGHFPRVGTRGYSNLAPSELFMTSYFDLPASTIAEISQVWRRGLFISGNFRAIHDKLLRHASFNNLRNLPRGGRLNSFSNGLNTVFISSYFAVPDRMQFIVEYRLQYVLTC
jgi:hypothetical protein